MSLDMHSASTVDSELTIPSAERSRSRSSRRPPSSASSIQSEVTHYEAFSVPYSTLEVTGGFQATYSVVSDVAEFDEWRRTKRAGALLDLVAKELSRRIGVRIVTARLETEIDAPEVQRVVLAAHTAMHPDEALPKLFDFTDSLWWTNFVRSTRGVVVVDVEFV